MVVRLLFIKSCGQVTFYFGKERLLEQARLGKGEFGTERLLGQKRVIRTKRGDLGRTGKGNFGMSGFELAHSV
jgi:hypothetical protein